MYNIPPESCALGAVTGIGYKLIAPILSSKPVFGVETKFAFFPCFIDLLCYAVYRKMAPVKNIFFHIEYFLF